MGLFKKNANEAAYVGGKKHWVDVIKNSGSGELLIWRQPEEDFNTNSTLIVMPGEAAIFVSGGQVQQVFQSGTYQLSTQNYPFISRLRNAFAGGVSAFNCVVYFVRIAVSRELRWGTSSRIQVRDKVWRILTDFGARGAYSISVGDPKTFLEKLVGNNIQLQTQEELFDYFGEQLKGRIVACISEFLNGWPIELIGLQAHMPQIAEIIHPYVNATLNTYGLKCENFSLSGLDIDTSKYDQIDDAQIQAMRMQTLGPKWATLTAADILKTLAQNPGAGGVAAAGAGLGMGVAASGAFGSLAQQMFAAFNTIPGADAASQQSTSNGSVTPEFDFDPVDEPPPSGDDPVAVLSKLKQLLDAGLIQQAQYDKKVEEVLSRM